MYDLLLKMSGEECFTLTTENKAIMYVDEEKVTILYPTGNVLEIPRAMIEAAIDMLKRQGYLIVEEVHNKITHQNGPRTDRVFAVLRKLPNVTFDKRPRKLYYKR